MQVVVVPSSVSPELSPRLQYLTSYLINDSIAVDAGSLGFYRTPEEQMRVKHVFLSHSHMDHVASLPIFLDNAYTGDGDCVTVYGSEAVIDCLRRDLFNDRLWPDFVRISITRPPYLKLRTLRAGQTVRADGLQVTPVEVNHAVPTFGYIIADTSAAVVIASDTAATEEIWKRARRKKNLKAVFLEATVNNDAAWLAELAKHLTPQQFAREVEKLGVPVRWIAVHIHARRREQVIRELEALGVPGLEVACFGEPYNF